MTSDYFTDERVTNADGGSQSDSPCRLDLVPAYSILEIAKVLRVGADKYGANNWRAIPVEDHINHALTHLYGWLAGDRSENHLVNAGCRVLFAIWCSEHHEDVD